MNIEKLKEHVCNEIDKHAEEIIDLAKDIEKEPELGFKEIKTSSKISSFFKKYGLTTEEKLAITGIKSKLKKESNGPNIAIMGEMDGIICPNSPKADPDTGATHTCGHHLQCGALMAAAAGFATAKIEDQLSGNVTFFAVPAEEFIEIEYREKLRMEGKIHFLGGKQELIKIGALDDVDMAMMVHAGTDMPKPSIGLGETGNGFVAKTIKYEGKATHAAAAPHEGINALNAAVLGINNVNAMRETFIDDDHVRVHFIITKGGDTVNSVPADVRMEAYVRAKSLKSIEQTHMKFDRAFKAGGDAVGAKTGIQTIPGYLPLACCGELNDLFAKNAGQIIPTDMIEDVGHFNASTDMGDICHIMPAIHPYTGGVRGALHSKDFEVTDYEAAIIVPAKAMAMTVIDLLAQNAEKGKEVLKKHKPLFTKEEYLSTLERFFQN